MNYKQRLERYRGDFESILELLDNVEIRVNNSNLITIQAICEERIKEIEDLIKHNNDFKKLDNLEMYRRFAYSKKGKNILKELGFIKS